MFIKLDKDYEVKTTLGTIRDMEKLFGKPFFQIVNSISEMGIEEQIKLLYVGVKKADPLTDEKLFCDLCEEHLGIGDLMDCLERYFLSLQYPGLPEEEVQERIEKKLQRSRELKAAGN